MLSIRLQARVDVHHSFLTFSALLPLEALILLHFYLRLEPLLLLRGLELLELAGCLPVVADRATDTALSRLHARRLL